MSAWGWPQWLYAGMFLLSNLIALAKDGEPRTGKHEFGITLASTFVCAWILWMGGFFG